MNQLFEGLFRMKGKNIKNNDNNSYFSNKKFYNHFII